VVLPLEAFHFLSPLWRVGKSAIQPDARPFPFKVTEKWNIKRAGMKSLVADCLFLKY
jgi:hypothetical protein